MDLTFLHDQIVNQRGHNIRLVLHIHRDLPELSFNFIRRCHLPQQSCLHFAFACISLCLSVFSHRGKLLFSLVTASFVPVNIPLRSILTMQHILGRKSFIVNPKSMMVLSNTGTMHFIIWGFVAVKGSRQMYLFPAIQAIWAAHFLAVNIMCIRMRAIPTLATLWKAYQFIQKTGHCTMNHVGSSVI